MTSVGHDRPERDISRATTIAPEPVAPNPVAPAPVLTDAQVARWRTEGFALVDGILPPALVDRLRTEATARFPAPGSPDAATITDFGSALTFPASLDVFNQVTLFPRLLATVAQLLDVAVADLRLTQSDLWPKYGHRDRAGGVYDNQDQRIHVDYPNHSLVHPPPWDRPEAVELILYLSDSNESGGGTAVVPRTGPDDPAYRWPIVDSPGIGDLDWVNDRGSAEAYLAEVRPEVVPWREDLYRRERHTTFTPGTVLLYRHDTWHRGTPLRQDGFRLAHNMTFRLADSEWISTLHSGWAWKMYRRDKLMERLIAEASLDQRAVLGFPRPGSRYWCPETVDAVAARYGPLGMDMSPYRLALAEGGD
ncbi:MAG: phytanoyl-CoA dioxygenase family protein [Actinomycetota bacterium]